MDDSGELEEKGDYSRVVVANSESQCEVSYRKQGKETFTIGEQRDRYIRYSTTKDQSTNFRWKHAELADPLRAV